MKKIIFLEGIPGVGKTTLLNTIAKKFSTINIVPEIINPNSNRTNQEYYLKNDEMKKDMYKTGIIVIDRSFISTLSYSLTKKIINPEYDISIINEWFEEVKKIYFKSNVKVIYLKTNCYIKFSGDEKSDPYGSIKNQKILQEQTIEICKKYVKNLIIIDYDYRNQKSLKEVISEIFN